MLRRALWSSGTRSLSTRPRVDIVEVSPRDGLQNEAKVLDVDTRAGIIGDLADLGLKHIEVGSLVSPKVKQMANTREVLLHPTIRAILAKTGTSRSILTVLVPNMRGFEDFQGIWEQLRVGNLNNMQALQIAVFVSATEAFSRANMNATRKDVLAGLEGVLRGAAELGVKTRAYVSCVAGCPFEGRVDPKEVQNAASALFQMGCYEISLGDTIGVGTPITMENVLNAVANNVPVGATAAHCHDTHGRGVVNSMHLVKLGVTSVDSSMGGLGGCPFAPGASGNVATEDIVKALEEGGYDTGLASSGRNPNIEDAFETIRGVRVIDAASLKEKIDTFGGYGQWLANQVDRESRSKYGRYLPPRPIERTPSR